MQKRIFWFFILGIAASVYTDSFGVNRRRNRSRKNAKAKQVEALVVANNESPEENVVLYRPTIPSSNPVVETAADGHAHIAAPAALSYTSTSDDAELLDTAASDQQYVADQTSDVPEDHQENNVSEAVEDTDLQNNIAEPDDAIEFQFENVDMQNFIKQIEDIFEVSFIMDDAIEPLVKGGRLIKGNKITYKTNKPLSRTQAWNLFLSFLQIAGFSVVKTSHDRLYRIAQIETARKLPLPLYIGTDYRDLPDSDELVRFVYFVENSPMESIKVMVDALRSSSSSLILLHDQKAFILTDRAYNIKVLMEIIKNLDKVSAPQTVSVLKLRQADARQVKELYDSIAQTDDKNPAAKSAPRRQPTTLFFPENMRMVAEPRTNSLILLGPQDAITKVETFIKKNIDKDIDQTYSPLYVYQLQYADANTIADIMNNVTQFGKDTEAGKNGGVRGVDKYMQPMSFVPEKENNRIIIKGYYEDYLKAIEVIKKLDEPQPQIAIEILLLSVSINDTKALGTQIRSKATNNGLLGDNIKFQTSGLFGTSTIAQNTDTTTGAQRLLGNLLQVVKGAAPGNTIVQLGSDLFGVWGVLQVLETITNTQVISNPFLMATNKTPSTVSLGEERRVRTAQVVGTNTVDSFGKDDANLKIDITPQINSDGMIVLDLRIIFDNFINSVTSAGENSATKNVREIKTSTTVSNNEILALGGLIRNRIVDDMSKVPVLGDIPVLGWLFKNKRKTKVKENLLILISTKIIDPDSNDALLFTQNHLGDFRNTIGSMSQESDKHDPIHKIFFDDTRQENEALAQNVIFDRQKKNKKRQRARMKTRAKAREQEIVQTLEAQTNRSLGNVELQEVGEQQGITSAQRSISMERVAAVEAPRIEPVNTETVTPAFEQEIAPAAQESDNQIKSLPIKPAIVETPKNALPVYRPRPAQVAQRERKQLSLSQFLASPNVGERS